MGKSLDTVSGVGLLLNLEDGDDGFEDPSEWLEEILSKYSHLTFDVARFGDYVGGAAVFAYNTVVDTDGVTPIVHSTYPTDDLSREEFKELRQVAEELEIPFEPKYITLVSYW